MEIDTKKKTHNINGWNVPAKKQVVSATTGFHLSGSGLFCSAYNVNKTHANGKSHAYAE